MPASNEVTLTLSSYQQLVNARNGDVYYGAPGNPRVLSGWTSVRITRGIERCPNDFEIELTERYPGKPAALSVLPGDICTVKIGDDVVITGHVDRVAMAQNAHDHSLRVTGRGMCADLVDCSAQWPGGQILASSLLSIAEKLCAPYGINVVSVPSDSGSKQGGANAVIPQFNLLMGETAWDVIERISRYRGVLAYERSDGSLVLSRVGTQQAASGFTEGINVEAANVVYSMDQRFSEYVALIQSVDVFEDTGNGGNLLGYAYDQFVSRHRRRVIIAEAPGGGQNIALLRAQWEAARRFGRSSLVQIVTDSWRDSAGALYTPNTLVPLSLPALKTTGKTWLIGEVTYRQDASGTHADLMVMPPEAFTPEPLSTQSLVGGSLPAELTYGAAANS